MSSPVPGRGPLPSLPSPPLSSVGGCDSLAAMGGSWKRGERAGSIRSGAECSRGFRDPRRGEGMRCERRTGAGGSERRARGSPSPNQTRDTSGRVERTRGVHDDGEAASELGPTLTHRRACPDGQDGAGHARGPRAWHPRLCGGHGCFRTFRCQFQIEHGILQSSTAYALTRPRSRPGEFDKHIR